MHAHVCELVQLTITCLVNSDTYARTFHKFMTRKFYAMCRDDQREANILNNVVTTKWQTKFPHQQESSPPKLSPNRHATSSVLSWFQYQPNHSAESGDGIPPYSPLGDICMGGTPFDWLAYLRGRGGGGGMREKRCLVPM